MSAAGLTRDPTWQLAGIPGHHHTRATTPGSGPPGNTRQPTCDPSALSVIRQIARLLADAPPQHPSEVALATADYPRAGPRRMWYALLDAWNFPVEEQVAHLNSPTLVVRGGRDAIVSQE